MGKGRGLEFPILSPSPRSCALMKPAATLDGREGEGHDVDGCCPPFCWDRVVCSMTKVFSYACGLQFFKGAKQACPYKVIESHPSKYLTNPSIQHPPALTTLRARMVLLFLFSSFLNTMLPLPEAPWRYIGSSIDRSISHDQSLSRAPKKGRGKESLL